MPNSRNLPVDPAGDATQIIGPTHPGPGPFQIASPVPEEMQTEVHMLPWSDKMYDPATVADMLRPSSSATAMVSPWWRTERNVLGDADGLPTPLAKRFDGNLAVVDQVNFVGNWERRPNQASGIPQPVKMSRLSQQFNEYLRAVQHHLIGSP